MKVESGSARPIPAFFAWPLFPSPGEVNMLI